MTRTWRCGGVLLACLGLAMPFLCAADDPALAADLVVLTGKVVPLADLVAKTGSKLDRDAQPTSLVLVAEDGKVYPLVKDAGARMFYQDKALLNRPMRLSGRFLPGSQILRVMSVRSLLKGNLHDVYYWCDVCSIRRSAKSLCDCCNGPLELREEPLKK